MSGAPAHYLIPHGISIQGDVTVSIRLFGFIASMIPNLFLMLGVWHLKVLFSHFCKLEFFTSDTTRRMKGFGMAVLVYGLVYPVSGGLLSLATSFQNPPGSRVIAITAGDHELMTLFLGGVILVIAWVMGEGKRLSDEIKQFV